MRRLGFLLCPLLFAGAARAGEDLHDALLPIVAGLESRWSRTDTEFIRIVAAEPARLTPALLAETEDFARRCIGLLGIAGPKLERLRSEPLVYLLVERPEDVELFTGTDAAGVALLRQRLIVSSHFPHQHEIAHLLAGVAVEDASEETPQLVANLPLLEEGFAGYLGGRRGLSALALRQVAEMRSPMPMEPSRYFVGGRETPGATMGDYFYANSARFVEYLIDRWGMPRFLELYRLLAGSRDEIEQRPIEVVRLQFEGHYGLRWPEISRGFQRWRRSNPPGGPRLCERPVREPDRSLALDARSVQIWNDPMGWVFHVEARNGYPEIAIGFGEALQDGAPSWAEASRRFELRLAPEFVQLRDLAQDQLLTHGFLPTSTADRQSAPPRAFTLLLPHSEMAGFQGEGELSLWAAPRVLWPPSADEPER